jgi:hypothetical protein
MTMLLLMVALLAADKPAPAVLEKPVIRYQTHCGWVPIMRVDKKGEKYFTGIFGSTGRGKFWGAGGINIID